MNPHPYDDLSPARVLDAVDGLGLISDGRLLALNSYENRVYQVGIEGGEPVVAKFYRPGRWSRAQLEEEHAFLFELAQAELGVVAPLGEPGRSLHWREPFWFALFPRRGGRSPELNFDTLELLGHSLGKLHALGAQQRFTAREALSVDNFAIASAEFLLRENFIPADLRVAYESLVRDVVQRLRAHWQEALALKLKMNLRLHGDCHLGNILVRDDQVFLVDFDDCRSGPAIQDLWMLLSGEREQCQAQLSALIEGYALFHDFDARELMLVETLRTLRLMHYSAWLARRWSDPAFGRSFPWFNTPRYWAQHVLELREQLAALDEAPLRLY
ncbi:MAG: serine/threonine protein kinase [Pseudomonadales bacterium]|jgi:Ser/Thr protein kinase RdoA (MazF antagonist)|nr:serine/threonine protein kinase [Pseudomonadales bacterium]